MYYVSFDFDISGLDAGYNLHFDLFTVDPNDTGTVGEFAPFSHDARTDCCDDTEVPEPGVIALFGTGLLLLGLVRLRRKDV